MWTNYCWLYKSAEIGLVQLVIDFFFFFLWVFKKLLIQFWVNPIMEPLHPRRGELGMNIGSDKSLDFGIYLFCLLKSNSLPKNEKDNYHQSVIITCSMIEKEDVCGWLISLWEKNLISNWCSDWAFQTSGVRCSMALFWYSVFSLLFGL